MAGIILQETHKLDAVFSKHLMFHPAGLAVDEFDGTANTVFVSDGQAGGRVSLGISRSLIWGAAQVDLWIHNTTAQVGKTIKLILTSEEAVATLIGGSSTLGLEVVRLANAGGTVINPATETTSAAILAKLIATPATAGGQASILAKLITAPATQATLASILAKIIAAPATEASSAAILAKIIAAPSTEAKQTTISGQLANQATVAWGIETVGVAAAALPDQAVPDGMGVFLKAKLGNANTIYIGGDDSVAAANGYPLVAAEEFPRALRVTNVNKIWAEAGAADQYLHWLVVAA